MVDNTKISSSFYTSKSSTAKSQASSSASSSSTPEPSTSSDTQPSSSADQGDTTTVIAGEGIYSIASRTGVPAETIAAANGKTVSSWYANPGDVIKLK